MNIVYGGSFNPPTKAHKEIINKLFTLFKPNNLIVVPVGNSYKKENLIDEKDRYNMVKLLDDRITISDIEFNNTYLGTYHLLKELNKAYDDLYYVIGADNLDKLSSWIESEKLLNEYKFIVFNRKNNDLKGIINKLYPNNINNFIIVEMDNDISSSSFRETKNKELLTKEVYEYIVKNKLYEVIV